MALTHAVSTNNYGPAKLIVATSAANGTHTTLASAMADASSGDTIFLRDSVTENVTITPGVNITAWSGGSLNVPSITGTLTMTAAGTSTISGLTLVTNSANVIAVTGSAASILNVINCYLSCTNNTGVSMTTSNAAARIDFFKCKGDLSTTGIAFFSSSSAGKLKFISCDLSNSGSSTTPSTISAGELGIQYSSFSNPITTSSTAGYNSNFNSFTTFGNNTALIIGGSGGSTSNTDNFSSGTAQAITCTSTLTLDRSLISSSNATPVGGAGTITFSQASVSSGNLIAPTTLTPNYFQYGISRSTNQPAFLAYLPSVDANATGDATVYTLGATTALTEVFDQNANFNTNGTFTAPVTGKYFFKAGFLGQDLIATMLPEMVIVTSNRNYTFGANGGAFAGQNAIENVVLADMDAADTTTFTYKVSNGTKVVDVYGDGTTNRSMCCGYLVC